MVLPFNGFVSASPILIYNWFLLANGVYAGIVAGVICMGIEKNSVDSPEY